MRDTGARHADKVQGDLARRPGRQRHRVLAHCEGLTLFRGDALNAYRDWLAPATIVSGGAYGVRGFHGDTIRASKAALPHWYRPQHRGLGGGRGPGHHAIWFWNTRTPAGPACSRCSPSSAGSTSSSSSGTRAWPQRREVTSTGRTIRQFPVVTRGVRVLLSGASPLTGPDGPMPPKQWVRARMGQVRASRCSGRIEACGVKNAATTEAPDEGLAVALAAREMTERLAEYANAHGLPTGWPHYSLTVSARSPRPSGTPLRYLAARARGDQRLVAPSAARRGAARAPAAAPRRGCTTRRQPVRRT